MPKLSSAGVMEPIDHRDSDSVEIFWSEIDASGFNASPDIAATMVQWTKLHGIAECEDFGFKNLRHRLSYLGLAERPSCSIVSKL